MDESVKGTMTSVDVVGESENRIAQTLCRGVSWIVGRSNGSSVWCVWRKVEEYESESSADDNTQLSHGGCK